MNGVKVNSWVAAGAALRLAKALGDASPVFQNFYNYHAREVDSVFETLAGGGDYRDLHWDGWAPSTIGRRRPSGREITAGSALLQDTGRARQDATTGVFVLTRDKLAYGPSIFYADEIYARRSPYSVTAADRAYLMALFKKAAADAVERGGRP